MKHCVELNSKQHLTRCVAWVQSHFKFMFIYKVRRMIYHINKHFLNKYKYKKI